MKPTYEEQLEEALDMLERSIPEEDDWLTFKKLLLNMLSPKYRKNFSTRDSKTWLHHPFNEHENNVRRLWKSRTGITLIMPENKRLSSDPKKYELE